MDALEVLEVLIVGCGYTGRRVAERLLEMGRGSGGTTRTPAGLADLAAKGLRVLEPEEAPPGLRVLYSVPPGPPVRLPPDPLRMVYLSSTGVYGEEASVDETTVPRPVTATQRARLDAERAVGAHLVLRPAAIYGPGRGVQEAMREGRHRLVGLGNNMTSRVHVDDLAALCVAALFSDVRGAFPVADERSCPAREVAEFCSDLLGLPMPPSIDAALARETLRFTRAVDGRAIFRALGVTPRYPDYRTGIPASL